MPKHKLLTIKFKLLPRRLAIEIGSHTSRVDQSLGGQGRWCNVLQSWQMALQIDLQKLQRRIFALGSCARVEAKDKKQSSAKCLFGGAIWILACVGVFSALWTLCRPSHSVTCRPRDKVCGCASQSCCVLPDSGPLEPWRSCTQFGSRGNDLTGDERGTRRTRQLATPLCKELRHQEGQRLKADWNLERCFVEQRIIHWT